jgi:hypothetical protein
MSSTALVQFSRRSLMKAAGSTLFVPLFVKRAFAQTATPARPNLVLLMQTNGVNQAGFWPTGTAFDSPILNKLLTDPQVGPKITLVKGINLKQMGSPGGNGHDWGFHGLYSGFDNTTSGSAHFGGGPSLDQTLLKKLTFTQPFKNIHCGVHAADYRLVNAGRASFSCEAVGRQVPAELNIYSLYTKVFSAVPASSTGTTTAPDPAANQAAMRRLAQRKSVLDAVAQDLTALQGRLGVSERGKVDAHLTAVREFEKRLSATAGGGGGGVVRPANCGSMMPSKTGVPTTGQGNEVNADALTRLFMEFIANAVACNMVGIISFQLGRGGEHFHYKWLNIPGMRSDFHDDIAHKDRNGDTVAGQVMVAVGKYHTELMTDLAKRLASFPQPDGKTALDNSLVVWGNEVANGYHGLETYPIVLIGGAAGRLKRTGYMASSGVQPHHRLGCTIHNIMGDPAKGFGAIADCGTIAGLELA